MRFVEKAIIQITSSLNLRGKLVVLYVLIVLVPTVSLGIVAGSYTLKSVRDNYMVTLEEAVRQTAQNIAFRKQAYDLLVVRTATDGELIARLSRDYSTMFELLDTVEYVDRSFLSTRQYISGIEDFRIYHANPSLVQDGSLLWKPDNRPLAGMSESEWFELAREADSSLLWINIEADPGSIVVLHRLVDKSGGFLGTIYMRLNYDTVFGSLSENPFDGAGDLYVLDANRRIVASSDKGQVGHVAEDSPFRDLSAGHLPIGGELSEGKQFYVQTIDSGWRVAAVIDMDQLERQSKHILYGIIGGIVFFLLLSTFLLLTVQKNIVWRIRKLGHRMNDIAEGEFNVSVQSRNKDELGELEMLFNSMTGKLGKLVEDITQAELKERELSFRALQAQINPHFIYNSLSLLRWRAMDSEDAIQLRTIDALTTFYRLALDNQLNVTRIEQEIEHVKAYIEIQQLRFPNQVEIQWDIDEEVLPYFTIKLLLQPIVENCYVHGYITRQKGALIQIAVKRRDESIEFIVQDNGKGMPAETLAQLRAGQRAGFGNGFGVANIRQRLQLYFGDLGHLTLDSWEGNGTLLCIRIPLCKERPDIRKGEPE